MALRRWLVMNNSDDTKATGWRAKAAFHTTSNKINSKTSSGKNQYRNSYEWLPSPFFYYKTIFPYINNGKEWINVRCCFHKEKNPSLSLNLISGGFYCHACGAKGGNLIAFDMLRNGTSYKDSAERLIEIKKGEK